MRVSQDFDGTVNLTLPDERRFTIRHDPARGTLYIQSLDGDMQLLPVSSDAIEIDTPLE